MDGNGRRSNALLTESLRRERRGEGYAWSGKGVTGFKGGGSQPQTYTSAAAAVIVARPYIHRYK